MALPQHHFVEVMFSGYIPSESIELEADMYRGTNRSASMSSVNDILLYHNVEVAKAQ